MYAGILRTMADVWFATVLPIFEDVMEAATFSHDRIEISSIHYVRMFYQCAFSVNTSRI